MTGLVEIQFDWARLPDLPLWHLIIFFILHLTDRVRFLFLVQLEFFNHHRNTSEIDYISFTNDGAFLGHGLEPPLPIRHLFAYLMFEASLVSQEDPCLVRQLAKQGGYVFFAFLLFCEIKLHGRNLVCIVSVFISNNRQAGHVPLVGGRVGRIDQSHVVLTVARDEAGSPAFALADTDTELAASLFLCGVGGLLISIQSNRLPV